MQHPGRRKVAKLLSKNPRIESAIPGRAPDFGSVLAHLPETASLFADLYAEFWQNGVLDPRIKEMTRIRNARITDCGY